jgi:hypothetical protein
MPNAPLSRLSSRPATTRAEWQQVRASHRGRGHVRTSYSSWGTSSHSLADKMWFWCLSKASNVPPTQTESSMPGSIRARIGWSNSPQNQRAPASRSTAPRSSNQRHSAPPRGEQMARPKLGSSPGSRPLAAALSRVSRRHGGEGGRLHTPGWPGGWRKWSPLTPNQPFLPPATQPLWLACPMGPVSTSVEGRAVEDRDDVCEQSSGPDDPGTHAEPLTLS